MSTQENIFNINDKVVILGSEHLVWIVESYKEEKDYNYIYSLKLTDGDFTQESLPWIPECLLELKVL